MKMRLARISNRATLPPIPVLRVHEIKTKNIMSLISFDNKMKFGRRRCRRI